MLVIVGTRPEAIKLAPLILKMPDALVCTTGQHPEMAAEALAQFGIVPDIVRQTDDVLTDTLPVAEDGVIVQGDTASALAGALAGYRAGVPVYHVEAGLRSHDLTAPWPEEGYRRMIAQVASYHFAPTTLAADNLWQEKVMGTVAVTGNTVLDAVRLAGVERTTDGPDILVTLHRREAIGEEMERVCESLASLERPMTVLAHPNPAVRAIIRRYFPDALEPMPYLEFLRLLASSRLVLTDSGGLQEECAYLGVPVLVAREVTERPEGVAAGCARLVGYDAVAHQIRLLDDPETYEAMAQAPCPYGDGYAADRIACLIGSSMV